MKKLLLTAGCLLWAAAACAATFQEAGEKYRAGDFKAAAQAYQELIRSGDGTSAVYYNLGNALLRSGKKAQALLAYERAFQADPRSADLRWNIGVVRSMMTDRPDEESVSWLETLRKASSWVSVDESAAVFLLLLAVSALLGWVRFLWRGAPVARLQMMMGAAVLLAAAVFIFQVREDGRRHAVITEPEAALRYGPAFSETRAFVLHEGAKAEVLDESGDWLYLSFGKNAGWLPKKNCEII